VAMGSGSEVSKQAARMILTDDNFGTLVHAVELGRSIYGKVVSYVRYQMSQLLALVLLFVTATIFDINQGVAMTPLMVLFLNFFIAIFPVVVILLDPADPTIMKRPPRDPKIGITNAPAVSRWIGYGAVLFVMALIPLIAGPDEPSSSGPSASMTMTFVVVGLGTIFSGIVMRREPTSGLTPPLVTAVKWSAIPLGLLILATELPFLQRGLHTQELTAREWVAAAGLAVVLPIVVEIDKWFARRRLHPPAAAPVSEVVAPARATVPTA
jgi:Ca2+-transporting ATPase